MDELWKGKGGKGAYPNKRRSQLYTAIYRPLKGTARPYTTV